MNLQDGVRLDGGGVDGWPESAFRAPRAAAEHCPLRRYGYWLAAARHRSHGNPHRVFRPSSGCSSCEAWKSSCRPVDCVEGCKSRRCMFRECFLEVHVLQAQAIILLLHTAGCGPKQQSAGVPCGSECISQLCAEITRGMTQEHRHGEALRLWGRGTPNARVDCGDTPSQARCSAGVVGVDWTLSRFGLRARMHAKTDGVRTCLPCARNSLYDLTKLPAILTPAQCSPTLTVLPSSLTFPTPDSPLFFYCSSSSSSHWL